MQRAFATSPWYVTLRLHVSPRDPFALCQSSVWDTLSCRSSVSSEVPTADCPNLPFQVLRNKPVSATGSSLLAWGQNALSWHCQEQPWAGMLRLQEAGS